MFQPVLTAEQMRSVDRKTIEEFGLDQGILMESAGRACADKLLEMFGRKKPIAVLCGSGNNGGDGMVLARTLLNRGAKVRVLLVGDEEKFARNPNATRLRTLAPSAIVSNPTDVSGAEVYVDAMLGLGVNGPVTEPYDAAIKWLNRQSAPKVSLDLPSGLEGETGIAHGECVQAAMTLTIGAHKLGLLVNDGPEKAGRVLVVEVGMPSSYVLEHAKSWLVQDIKAILPQRSRSADKYSAGTVLAMVSSVDYPGAGALACKAAGRSGAGYVMAACPEAAAPVMSAKLDEEVVLSLPSAGPESMALLERSSEKAHAFLLGPGCGRQSETQERIRDFASKLSGRPVVLDADGLNAFVEHAHLLAGYSQGNWLLTPHWGEFARLTGETDFTRSGQLACNYASTWNCHILLKGNPSILATHQGVVYIPGNGASGALATAGTGDVLAGMCAGLAAQGVSMVQAGVIAMHLGGAAADRWSAQKDPRSFQAGDIIADLPWLMNASSDAADAASKPV